MKTIRVGGSSLKIPSHPITLMTSIYSKVLPATHTHLNRWKSYADSIKNGELRYQALQSIETKTFHCEGGAIYSLLAGIRREECIRFIVAYQTISDYLDNLCDRSTSQDPKDFRKLHDAMLDALTPGAKTSNYYMYREDQEDNGYLDMLVKECQDVLGKINHYQRIGPYLIELASYYCDLQVHKHVSEEQRIPRLKNWFHQYNHIRDMSWYEFSACAGSTLGIFCLVAYACRQVLSDEDIMKVKEGYFPYVQGLHILLDYFIDQEEDRKGGDLNFCFYYPHHSELINRLEYFFIKADENVSGLPNEKFHKLINYGLVGLYLSDPKVMKKREIQQLAKQLLKPRGIKSWFFYLNSRIYRSVFKKMTLLKHSV